MRILAVFLGLVLILSGCGGVVSATPDNIAVRDGAGVSPAREAADHCAKYGKVPRLVNTQPAGNTLVVIYYFDCVKA
jgi:hypothetical protein